jgi:hypothetical protein
MHVYISFSSLEYQHIHNYPESGLQFVAELGGLMAFFYGISIISILECFLYCCFGGWKIKELFQFKEPEEPKQPILKRPSVANCS